jgi:hypothetical protein
LLTFCFFLITQTISILKRTIIYSKGDYFYSFSFSILKRPFTVRNNEKNKAPVLEIQKGAGYQRSDSLVTRHELSDGVDFDCIGNTLTSDRLKNNQALQGFFLDRQAGLPKGPKVNGGSLICQSLDRQGRLQNTTLANGVNAFSVDELKSQSSGGQKAFRVRLEMTDGALIHREFERIFTTRNLP